ncbi:MAG TPA: formate dehydrogenase accessory protein FdhE [Desulfomicrobiaceae bacterium]|nr:formate dehydrogenase accessory protein FdhE [Desulfomicrobiaceae bacterium]
MPLDTEKELRLLKKRTDAIYAREFLPESLVSIISRVYETQLLARADAAPVVPPADKLTPVEKRVQGAPLLAREDFPLDRDQAGKLFNTLLDMLLEEKEGLGEAAGIIRDAIAAGELSVPDTFTAFLQADEPHFFTWAEKMPQAPRTLVFLAQAALTPGIEVAAAELEHHLDLNTPFRHGHCPICGSLPLIGELRAKEGFKHLTCSFCHSSYRVPRLLCPFCLEEDTGKLEFFEAGEEPGFRVDTCRTCNMYIKTTDFRKMDRNSLPLVDDLDSLPLDIRAQKENFKRATLSAWGF